MSYDKNFWEQKERNIELRNNRNRNILKEYFNDENKANEVAGLLEQITATRHDIHIMDSLFDQEHYANKEHTDFIENINYDLDELGLKPIDFPYQIEDIVCDIDVYELGMDRDEALEEFESQKEEIVTAIEKWLQDFDKTYGTDYAPTGMDRLKKDDETMRGSLYLVQAYDSKTQYEEDDYYKVGYFNSIDEAKQKCDDLVSIDSFYKALALDTRDNYRVAYETKDEKELGEEEEEEE